jgi:hypothetical protein
LRLIIALSGFVFNLNNETGVSGWFLPTCALNLYKMQRFSFDLNLGMERFWPGNKKHRVVRGHPVCELKGGLLRG